MNREQAINYLISSGFTHEQVGEVVRALTYEPTTKNNLAGDIMDFPKTFDEFANFYGFKDKDEVYTNGSELIPVFRVKQWLEHISTTKNSLGVEEITALAEWTEKLTKASEDAYNKGYADGMKAQEPRKGHWLRRPHVYGVTYCSICDFELKIDNTNYCPNCGAKMESEVDNGNVD